MTQKVDPFYLVRCMTEAIEAQFQIFEYVMESMTLSQEQLKRVSEEVDHIAYVLHNFSERIDHMITIREEKT